MTDCVFCDRLHHQRYWDTPDDRVVRFSPLNPVTPGHMLFVPKRHVPDALQDPWLTGVVFQAAAHWAATAVPDLSCNLITSCGSDATQTIRHLHVHVVPRTQDDGLKLPWSP